MIVKGRSRKDGGQLAAYLLDLDGNDNVIILETASTHDNDVLGLYDSLTGFDEVTGLTNGSKGLYHAQVSPEPGEDMDERRWLRGADILGEKLGLGGQSRVIVLQEKNGHTHAHVVWQRTDEERGVLISDSHNYVKHELASRQMEREFNHPLVRGQFTARARNQETGHFAEPRPGYDPETDTYKPKNHDQAATQQAERTGVSPEQRKAEITALWRQSDSGQAFVSAAHSSGYDLARGDKKPIHFLIKDAELYDLRRNLDGVKKKEIEARLADYPAEHLPMAAEVRKRQLEQMREREQQAQELKAQFDQARDPARDTERSREDDAAVIARDDDAPHMDERGEPEAEIFDRDSYHAEWEASIQQAGIEHALAEEQRRHEDTANGNGDSARQKTRPASREEIDEWGNGIRAETQSRQHDEQIALGREQTLAQHPKEDQFKQEYGERRESLEQQIMAIEARQERGGLWYWLSFRQRREDQEILPELYKSVENSAWREEQAKDAFEKEQRLAREALEESHRQEREADERTITQAFDSGHIPEDEPTPEVIRVPEQTPATPAEPASAGSNPEAENLPAWMDDSRMAEAWQKYASETRDAPQHSQGREPSREGPSPGGM